MLGVTKLSDFNGVNARAHSDWIRLFENVYAPLAQAQLTEYSIPGTIHHGSLRRAVGTLEVFCGAAMLLGSNSRFCMWTLSLLMSGMCLVVARKDNEALVFPLVLTGMSLFVSATIPKPKQQ
jgi:uncharacterized membrane protein YphA (DoxX/SURF4 family)